MFKKYCMVEIAFDDIEKVNKVCDELLDKKLISSCQIVESKSKWNWKNKREESNEYLIFLKTKKSNLKNIYSIIEEYHNYECFEFATFNLKSTNKEYLNWIDSEILNK